MKNKIKQNKILLIINDPKPKDRYNANSNRNDKKFFLK